MKSRSVNRLRAVSLFSSRFSESNARARERRSRETPSVTRVAIYVCRVLLDGPQKKERLLVVYSVKRNAKNAWGQGERQGSLPFLPPPPPPFPSRTCLIFRSARFNTIPTILAESLAQAKKTEAETGCNEEYGGRYTIIRRCMRIIFSYFSITMSKTCITFFLFFMPLRMPRTRE